MLGVYLFMDVIVFVLRSYIYCMHQWMPARFTLIHTQRERERKRERERVGGWDGMYVCINIKNKSLLILH